MGNRAAKDQLFAALTTSARALGVGRRAEIVDVLSQSERSVQELANEVGQSVANTSHHLHALAAAGLVRSRRIGTQVIYTLASPQVERAWIVLRELAATQLLGFDSVAEAYTGPRGDLPIVSRAETAAGARGGAVLIDVRPEAEYLAGHIPGALHLPPASHSELLQSLPDGPVIAYCRGEFCIFADNAVRLLIAFGREAARMEGGFPEWRLGGLPFASGTSPGRFPRK